MRFLLLAGAACGCAGPVVSKVTVTPPAPVAAPVESAPTAAPAAAPASAAPAPTEDAEATSAEAAGGADTGESGH